jgi:21S rRNA (GM2251-2'-O)-methyltransferase
VIGADAGPKAVDSRQLALEKPTVLVMGSEGYGLRTNVKRSCSMHVRISAADSTDSHVLDSLNVSVATGILLHNLSKGQRCPEGQVLRTNTADALEPEAAVA